MANEPKWKVNEEGIVVLKRRHRYRNGDVYEGEWIKGFPQGVGRIEYRNGDVYEGKVSMCVPNGNGSLIFMQGKRKYQGEFENGLFHGNGTIEFEDGSKYEGEFRDGKFHGSGKLIRDGKISQGEFSFGYMHGTGTQSDEKMSYSGEWQFGQFHGKGRIQRAPISCMKTSYYEGEFNHGNRHGKGIQQYLDGTIYDGQWKRNIPNGNGQLRVSDIYRYFGEMKNGKMHGNGSLALFNGDNVVGQFSRGSLHGRGRYSFAAGGWYEGEFQEKQWTRDSKTMRFTFGVRQGKGERVYCYNARFIGTWENDEPSEGRIEDPENGRNYNGSFQRGVFHGYGECEYFFSPSASTLSLDRRMSKPGTYVCPFNRVHDVVNGSCIYKGEWDRGSWHGMGEFTCVDGRKYEGCFYQGSAHGEGRMYLMTDTQKESVGQLLYHPIIYQGNFVHGQRHGQGEVIYASGDCIRGNFNRGELDGEAIHIFPSGRQRKAIYKRGKRLEWLEHLQEES